MKAALYARVSTKDQNCELQLDALRKYAAAYGWETSEYVDTGQSGAKQSRPALDRMLGALRQRQHDVVLVWKLDRLGRSLHNLLGLLEEFRRLRVEFISTSDGINASGNAGKLVFAIFGAIAEFERSLITERVKAGQERCQARLAHGPYRRPDGHLVTHIGRKKGWATLDLDDVRKRLQSGQSLKSIGRSLGVPESTIRKYLKKESSNGCKDASHATGETAPGTPSPEGSPPEARHVIA